MKSKKVQLECGDDHVTADAYPISEFENHLVVVRIGSDECMPSEEELDNFCEEFTYNTDVLTSLNDASFLITKYDIGFKKCRLVDFVRPHKSLPWRYRFKKIWLALKGF